MKLRRQKKQKNETETEYVDSHSHRSALEFHPHCVIPALAVAEARQFDELYALAHNPVRGEEETEA